MISDTSLYSLSVFLGSLSMLLIVLYHFLQVNARDDDNDGGDHDSSSNTENIKTGTAVSTDRVLRDDKAGVGAVKPAQQQQQQQQQGGTGTADHHRRYNSGRDKKQRQRKQVRVLVMQPIKYY